MIEISSSEVYFIKIIIVLDFTGVCNRRAFATERTITSKHVQSDSQQVIIRSPVIKDQIKD